MSAKITIVLAVLASGFATLNAQAHSHLNCHAYANSVVAQAKKNIGLGCGFSGPVWSTDYSFHFNWCNQNTTQIHHLGEQENIRAAQMQQCLQKVKTKDQKFRNKQEYCLKYAKEAQDLRGKLNNACKGQDGGEWPQTLKQDVEFCMAKGGSYADLTNRNRAKQITACSEAAFTKTYNRPANFRGTPLDGCNENGTQCGKPIANAFCRGKGHKHASSFETGGTDFTVYSFCLSMNAARKQRYIDAGGKCHCSSNSNGCGYFKHITCQGKR